MVYMFPVRDVAPMNEDLNGAVSTKAEHASLCARSTFCHYGVGVQITQAHVESAPNPRRAKKMRIQMSQTPLNNPFWGKYALAADVEPFAYFYGHWPPFDASTDTLDVDVVCNVTGGAYKNMTYLR